jgi:hypothetical protein
MHGTGSLDEISGEWIGDDQVVEEAKQVCYITPVIDMLQCVNDVMFNKLQFTGATTSNYTPQVSCIDKVSIVQYMCVYTTSIFYARLASNMQLFRQF